MTLHPDEQARELVDRIFDAFGSEYGPSRTGIEESVAALLAKVRLAEAEWWHGNCHTPDETGHYYHLDERLVALRQAAGEGTK